MAAKKTLIMQLRTEKTETIATAIRGTKLALRRSFAEKIRNARQEYNAKVQSIKEQLVALREQIRKNTGGTKRGKPVASNSLGGTIAATTTFTAPLATTNAPSESERGKSWAHTFTSEQCAIINEVVAAVTYAPG